MDAVLHFFTTLGYYALNLGWLLAIVAGLAMLCFGRTRWWGAGTLAVGVIWVGVFVVIDMKYAAEFRNVEKNFPRLMVGMSPNQVRSIVGEPTIDARWGAAPGKWLFFRQIGSSGPKSEFPFWRVRHRSWTSPDLGPILELIGESMGCRYTLTFDDTGHVSTYSLMPDDEFFDAAGTKR